MTMQWYVIQTLFAHEDKVKRIIEQEKKRWPEKDQVGEVKVPTIDMAELRGGKKKIVKKKFIPGYVFVQMNLTEELLRKMRTLPGIMGFVSSGSKPQVLSEEEIRNLFAEIGGIKTEEKSTSRILFTEGETVRILEGPFSNFQGVIDEVNSEKGKVKVLVEIFGRSTPVELDYLEVGRV